MMPNGGAQTIVTLKHFSHVDKFRQADITHFHEYAVWLIVLWTLFFFVFAGAYLF